MASPDYHDVHCWTFVTSSFKLILGAIFVGGRTGLSVRSLHPDGEEFFVALSCEGPVEPYDLDALAAASAAEERQASVG